MTAQTQATPAKAKVEEAVGFKTKDLAAKLGITPRTLRKALRKMERYADGVYTRYRFTQREFDNIVKAATAPKAEKAEKAN